MNIVFLSSDAGRAFTEAAKLHEERLDSRHEAANSYADAAQVYKKTSPQGIWQYDGLGLCLFLYYVEINRCC